MIREPITTDPLDDHRFPPDPWKLIETYPTPGDLGQMETLFSVANGYLGMRGNPEEGLGRRAQFIAEHTADRFIVGNDQLVRGNADAFADHRGM